MILRSLPGLALLAFAVMPAAVPAAPAAAPPAPSSAARPNIVFIMSDDHRWDCVGTAGNPNVVTPALDQLTREGVHFVQGTMHIPQCSPGRAQILTGLPPHANGWYSNATQRRDVKDPDGFRTYPTLPGKLRDAGYQTVFIGKWHLASHPWNCGFTEVRRWLGKGAGKYVDLPMSYGNSRETAPTKGFVQEVFGEDATQFLREARAKEKPFFMWLAFTAPHGPTGPNPKRLEALYAGKSDAQLAPPGFRIDPSERLTSFTVHSNKPGGKAKKAGAKANKGGGKAKRPPQMGRADEKGDGWQNYYAAISSVDEQVGSIRRTLKEQGLDRNTIIVFIGDNGLMRGSRGWSGKALPYEESVRVPLIVYAPGVGRTTGQTSATASSLDLPPSLLAWAGVPTPPEWPGRDLTPVLKGESSHGIDYAVSEFPDNQGPKFGPIAYRAVRTPTSKLIVWQDPAKGTEFFNLAADPRELHNRIADPASQPEIARLRALLTAWQAKTKDTTVTGPTVQSDDEE